MTAAAHDRLIRLVLVPLALLAGVLGTVALLDWLASP